MAPTAFAKLGWLKKIKWLQYLTLTRKCLRFNKGEVSSFMSLCRKKIFDFNLRLTTYSEIFFFPHSKGLIKRHFLCQKTCIKLKWYHLKCWSTVVWKTPGNSTGLRLHFSLTKQLHSHNKIVSNETFAL